MLEKILKKKNISENQACFDELSAPVIAVEPEQPAVYWTFWQVVLAGIAAFVFSDWVGIWVYGSGIDIEWGRIAVSAAQNLLFLLLPIIVVRCAYHYDWQALGFRRIESPLLPVKAVILGLLLYFLSVMLLRLISLIYPFDIEFQTSVQPLLSSDSLIRQIIWIVLTVLIVPVAEETFFRGFLYGSVRYHFMPVPSALISSLLFAVMHMDLFRLVPIFIFGYVQCRLYEKYKNIYLNIILHAAYNGFSLFLLKVFDF